jgi:hemoglobin-like flavoprotein
MNIRWSGITDHDILLFNDSLERCTAKPGFLECFYDTFMASSKEVAEKFQHTNFQRQTILLKASLYLMMLVVWDRPEGPVHLDRIAAVHSRRGHDIKPELYELWLDCLIHTIQEFDQDFDREVENAWRKVLRPGIDFMKSRY